MFFATPGGRDSFPSAAPIPCPQTTDPAEDGGWSLVASAFDRETIDALVGLS
jgi:hypothetical protein